MDAQPQPRIQLCDNLDAAIAKLIAGEGYRLDMIMPADAPRIARLSRSGEQLLLQLDQPPAVRPAWDPEALWISRAVEHSDWGSGRAGMRYRDLVPSRLDGRLIASHIGIPGGGPVADYVHFHRIGYQLIYCLRGWVRVVYEDQGEPFLMRAGDCVLQPPLIRHRVLESGDDLEVLEIASPAEHETFRDHDLILPNEHNDPDRDFEGQRFLRHLGSQGHWFPSEWPGFEARDTGLAAASAGRAALRVLRATSPIDGTDAQAASQAAEIHLLYSTHGALRLQVDGLAAETLSPGDLAALPGGRRFSVSTSAGCELLEFRSG